MIIRRIEIENFQCYFGTSLENVFEFETGVNIISGKNGAGKSKLFNAFHWTLFGSIYSNIEKDWIRTLSSPTRIISRKAKSDCELNNSVTTSVKLVLIAPNVDNESQNREYTFFRKISATKEFVDEDGDGGWKVSIPENLKISYKLDNGETEFFEETQNEYVIDKIFPTALRKYMWFQGEAIDKLIDFRNSNTLQQAIQRISYYPYYQRLNKISSIAKTIISGNINKHLIKNQRANDKLRKLIKDIEFERAKLNGKETEREEIKEKLQNVKESLSKAEIALKNYDHFPELEKKLNNIENRDRLISSKISNLESLYREKFVNNWMLKGTDSLIKKADSILDGFTEKIKAESDTDNPIPIKIPGKKYIQRMLDDKFCYICERAAPEHSEEYLALRKRLGESSKQEEELAQHKVLELNYTILRNLPSEILDSTENIDKELKEWDKQIGQLFEDRRKLKSERDKLELQDEAELKRGAASASKLTQNLIFYKDEEKKYVRLIDRLTNEIAQHKAKLKVLETDRDSFSENNDRIPEQDADIYINALELVTEQLKESALVRLLGDIERRGNELYAKYLESSNSPKGYLVIDPETYEILVLDEGERKDINQGNEVAAKMSVINSILSLSSEKIGKDYPLIADAPSSVFDQDNTKTYTEKINETFTQVILMSKDYSAPENLNFISGLSSISKVYFIENKKIDDSGNDGESNHRTFITNKK